jgi:hypothetical protein
MNTAAIGEPRIVQIDVADKFITAELNDGRVISVPLTWS